MRPLAFLVPLILAAGCGGSPQPAGDAVCGDGIRQASELCDGGDLGAGTCASVGLGQGTLACNATCDAYVTTGCCTPSCGGRECGLDPVCGTVCGTCSDGTCSAAGVCEDDGPTCLTCADVGAECGVIDNGCGSTLTCGSCSGGEVCGAQQVNQCGTGTCSPRTCGDAGAECGTIDDGCGNPRSCGSCSGGEVCGGGGTPNVCAAPPAKWTQIKTGAYHTCGVKDDGSLWCWGRNDHGQLGVGTVGGSRTTPQRIGTSYGWTEIAAGGFHTCGIQFNHLYCWGRNDDYQLGDSTTTAVYAPKLIESAREWSQVVAGWNATCARSGFDMHCWGNNDYQQQNDELGPVKTPQYVGNQEEIGVGGGHICYFTQSTVSDILYCGGLNTSGQLGINSADPMHTRASVWRPESNWYWRRVWTGGSHSCAFGFTGLLVCWGNNEYGQLGNQIASEIIPSYVDGLSDWETMGLGDIHTCGIKTNGNLLCWGGNDGGQVGDGTMVDREEPVLIGSGFASVAGGYAHTCALKTDGTLYCWGSNASGQLGTGGSSSSSPVVVP